MTHFDVLVLGAGPGGYVAAIRAAQLGKSVAVVENQYWGGVCLNVGCIPSKALLKNAELAHVLSHEKDKFGIEGDATMSFGPTHARSRQVSAGIVKGVHFLMKKNKITEIDGWGTLTGPQAIDVKDDDGGTTSYTFDNLILATGATVRMLPGMQVSDNVVTYEEQILDENLPRLDDHRRLRRDRRRVRLRDEELRRRRDDRGVPRPDGADRGRGGLQGAAQALQEARREGAAVDQGRPGRGHRLRCPRHRQPRGGAARQSSQVLEADKMLAAFGFAPRVEGYGLDAAGVETTERGAIAIDDRGRTNVDGIWAIGDVTGKFMLAHVAEAHGHRRRRDDRRRRDHRVDFDMVPRATYCQPQIGSFGYSEAQAKEKGYDVKTATFPFSANGKAQGLGDAVGFVKVVADAEHNEILGAHMIGPDVTEQLPVLTLAQKWDLTADEVARNVFAHPTLSEAVKEAVHGIAGHMINL